MRCRNIVLVVLAAIVFSTAPQQAQVEIGELVFRRDNLIEVVGPDPALDLQGLIDDTPGASATNRYLIKLGPGDYDLGSATLVMKPFVDLAGSGQATTEILGDRANSGGDCGTDFGVVAADDHTQLSDLTITNVSSSADSATALCNVTGSSPSIRRVTALTRPALAGAGNRYAVHVVGGEPQLIDLNATSDGGGFAIPIRCVDSSASFWRTRVSAKNADNHRGIWLVGTCALEMRDLRLLIEGNVVNTGIEVQAGTEIDLTAGRLTIDGTSANTGMVVNGKAVLHETRIQPKNGTSDNRGINVNLDGQLKLFRCSVSGDPTVLQHNSTNDTLINQSSLVGAVVDLGSAGAPICVATDDGAGTERLADCSVPP